MNFLPEGLDVGDVLPGLPGDRRPRASLVPLADPLHVARDGVLPPRPCGVSGRDWLAGPPLPVAPVVVQLRFDSKHFTIIIIKILYENITKNLSNRDM